MSSKSAESVADVVCEGLSVCQTIEIDSSDMEIGGCQSSSAVNVSDLVALIVKFKFVIFVPDYTIMVASENVDHLLEVVGDVKIPMDTAYVRDDVSRF